MLLIIFTAFKKIKPAEAEGWGEERELGRGGSGKNWG